MLDPVEKLFMGNLTQLPRLACPFGEESLLELTTSARWKMRPVFDSLYHCCLKLSECVAEQLPAARFVEEREMGLVCGRDLFKSSSGPISSLTEGSCRPWDIIGSCP